jgi:ribosomal protein S6
MVYYHVYMLARPDASRELLVDMLSRMSQLVVQRGGVLRGIDNLGIRHLAYMMRRHQHVGTVARFVSPTWSYVCSKHSLAALSQYMLFYVFLFSFRITIRYVRMHVDCHPSTIQMLDQELNTNEDVLRWSVLKQPEGLAAIKSQMLKINMNRSMNAARRMVRDQDASLDMRPLDRYRAMIADALGASQQLDSFNVEHVLTEARQQATQLAAQSPNMSQEAIDGMIANGVVAAVKRLQAVAEQREAGLLRLAVRDAKGQIVATPWFLDEARRVSRFKKQVSRAAQQSGLAALNSSSSAQTTGDEVKLEVSLLHHLEHANAHYQDLVTKVTQGPLSKFRL